MKRYKLTVQGVAGIQDSFEKTFEEYIDATACCVGTLGCTGGFYWANDKVRGVLFEYQSTRGYGRIEVSA